MGFLRSHRLRILLCTESLLPGRGGIARVARLVAKVLSEEVSVGRLEAKALAFSDPRLETGLGLPVITAYGSRPRFLLEVQRRSLEYTHYIYDFLGMARAHCLLPGIRRPFMTCIHGIEVWPGTRQIRIHWARRANLLWTNSYFTRKRADETFGGFGDVPVCWLATENDELAPIMENSLDPPTVTILARIDENGGYKGHRELIDCWPQVVAQVREARLLIAGSGPGLPLIQKLASESPVSRQIEVKGFVPEEKMEDVWRRTWVLAMPSRGEGFGLVYVEAMRYGIPVIASVHDAGEEVNHHGITGYNVNLDDEEELPSRIIEILQDSTLAKRLGQAGRTLWTERFRYSAFKERFKPILERFLEMC